MANNPARPIPRSQSLWVDFCSSQEHRRTFPLSAMLVSGEAGLAVAFHTSYMARAHFQRGPHPFPTQGAGVGGWPGGVGPPQVPCKADGGWWQSGSHQPWDCKQKEKEKVHPKDQAEPVFSVPFLCYILFPSCSLLEGAS